MPHRMLKCPSCASVIIDGSAHQKNTWRRPERSKPASHLDSFYRCPRAPARPQLRFRCECPTLPAYRWQAALVCPPKKRLCCGRFLRLQGSDQCNRATDQRSRRRNVETTRKRTSRKAGSYASFVSPHCSSLIRICGERHAYDTKPDDSARLARAPLPTRAGQATRKMR